MFREVKHNIAEAIEAIEKYEKESQHSDEDNTEHYLWDHVEEISHLSRTLNQVCAISRAESKIITDGNEIVRRWWSDLAPLIK